MNVESVQFNYISHDLNCTGDTYWVKQLFYSVL